MNTLSTLPPIHNVISEEKIHHGQDIQISATDMESTLQDKNFLSFGHERHLREQV